MLFGSALAVTAKGAVPKEWRTAAKGTDGVVGAAALHLTSGQRFSMNGDERFPLASVCKLPIAMNILALVDEGKLALTDAVEVLPTDVWAGVSDIAPRWPAERRFPLNEMLELMVARSDNTAVETLFRIGGGGPSMAARFRRWNVRGVRVDRSERQCDLDRNGVVRYPPPDQWTDATINDLIARVSPATQHRAMLTYLKDPRDTGTPDGTVQLLGRAFRGEVLSKTSTAHLVEILKATTTSPTRLKGLLPPGTVVAHKTGTTSTVNGLTAATNDSGVIFLPDGSHLAVSVYIKASTRSPEIRDAIIARIARAAFDSPL
jgi:beta-lactamase class A